LDTRYFKKGVLQNKMTYNIYIDNNFDADQSVSIWNASVSYALMKNKSLTVMHTKQKHFK